MTVRGGASTPWSRMRPQGLRPVQIWIPDVRSPEFAAEAHRQSALVAAADRASDDMDFVEAVSDDWDE
ncbi:antitoxin MazE family protein [soil metagenome]